jgi:putative ABC transport system permease protein
LYEPTRTPVRTFLLGLQRLKPESYLIVQCQAGRIEHGQLEFLQASPRQKEQPEMRDWIARSLEFFALEVRHAVRGLRRSPDFALTVIVTMSLGIGVNATMFDVVDRLMFKPLTYLSDPGTVHRIYWQWEDRGTTITTSSTQYASYLDLRNWTSSFSQLAAFYEVDLPVGEGAATSERRVGAVSASFFQFFDVRPALGRYFGLAEDSPPRGADVAVLAHGLWQTAYGGRDVLGETVKIGNIRATIIGVAARGFEAVDGANPPAVYVPITTYAASTATDDAQTYFSRYHWSWVNVLARRAHGVTRERAQADASQAFRRTWPAANGDNPNLPALDEAQPRVAVSAVRPGAGPNPSLEARTALWLSIVAGFVLIIACANVTNLFLIRTTRRRHETVVRLALGARRWRLLLRPVTESVVLAVGGGGLSLLFAQWAGAAVRRVLLTSLGTSGSIFNDGRVFWITLLLTTTSGIFVGLTAAVLSGRVESAAVLRTGLRAGRSEGGGLRYSLLVVQVAVSVMLLIGAVLFVRSVGAVRAERLGYEPDRVLLVNRVIMGDTFEDSIQVPMRRTLLQAAQSLPVVESAAWVSSKPFVSTSSTRLYVDGVDSVGLRGVFTYQATTPDYFRTMGTRIMRGRGFSAEDRSEAPPVAVVSEGMARKLWPNQDAIGRCFRMREESAPCVTVVGIAEDIIQRAMTQIERYHYYLPIEQFSRTWGNGMVLRLNGDPVQHAERVRAALQRVIPPPSYLTVQPLGQVVHRARRSWRLGATVFAVFGLLAVIVAAVGLYGAIGYDVTQRTHELGIRTALGAGRKRILWLVLRQSVRLAAVGAMMGGFAVALSAHWMQPLLYRQSATDLRVYAGVGAVMLLVALAASAVPAVRASGIDPNLAMRAE